MAFTTLPRSNPAVAVEATERVLTQPDPARPPVMPCDIARRLMDGTLIGCDRRLGEQLRGEAGCVIDGLGPRAGSAVDHEHEWRFAVDLEDDHASRTVDEVTVVVLDEVNPRGLGGQTLNRSLWDQWTAVGAVDGSVSLSSEPAPGVRGGAAPDADVGGRLDLPRRIEARFLDGARLAGLDGASCVAGVRPRVGEDPVPGADAGSVVPPGFSRSGGATRLAGSDVRSPGVGVRRQVLRMAAPPCVRTGWA